jgi:hypothetical protein
MTIRIYKSKYKDQTSVTMENQEMAVQFLPELGGKMASLVCKRTGMEFLAQGENENYKILSYDGNYVEAECSGFDDMFPTIDRTFYTDYPWKGIEIPDHGEVCGLKWENKILKETLYMSVYGLRLPYKLEKWVTFESENVLNIKYKATNPSNFDMDFIWAAHPMINVEEGGEVLLPYKKNSETTCVFSMDHHFGKYGDHMSWPEVLYGEGNMQNISRTLKRNEKGNNYKIYFDEKVPEGWCAYKYKSQDRVLTLSYPVDKVSYLGLWVNEGSFHGLHNIAMEPCTGTYDRIDLAKIHHQNSVLKSKGEYSWFLNFHIEQLDQFLKEREVKK